MIRGLALGLLLVSCIAPPREELGTVPAHAASTGTPVPGEQKAELAELAARVDLLHVLRSSLAEAPRRDPRPARRTWRVHLVSMDAHVEEFLARWPELPPAARVRLEETVLRPLRALRAAEE